jgi:hypothetical protein
MMNSYLKNAIDRFNNSLLNNQNPRKIFFEGIFFVLSKDVFWKENHFVVKRENFIQKDVSGIISNLLEGGPSWINFSLMFFDNEPKLIAIDVGRNVGNPNPTLTTGINYDSSILIE